MSEKFEEWLRQADYDIETAVVMLNGGRHFYAVFMCHLAVEKALKGLYTEVLAKTPPKTHNLIYLLNAIDKRPQVELEKFYRQVEHGQHSYPLSR